MSFLQAKGDDVRPHPSSRITADIETPYNLLAIAFQACEDHKVSMLAGIFLNLEDIEFLLLKL